MGIGDMASAFLTLNLDRVSGELHIPAASLTPKGRSLWYPLNRDLGGPEHCGEDENLLPCQESNFDRPAYSLLLY
jgi:hypothetical protein